MPKSEDMSESQLDIEIPLLVLPPTEAYLLNQLKDCSEEEKANWLKKLENERNRIISKRTDNLYIKTLMRDEKTIALDEAAIKHIVFSFNVQRDHIFLAYKPINQCCGERLSSYTQMTRSPVFNIDSLNELRQLGKVGLHILKEHRGPDANYIIKILPSDFHANEKDVLTTVLLSNRGINSNFCDKDRTQFFPDGSIKELQFTRAKAVKSLVQLINENIIDKRPGKSFIHA